MAVLNNWDEDKIYHKKDILEFEFLHQNEYIMEIEDDYYYLSQPMSVVETAFYTAQNKALMKELNIENVEKELKSLIKKLNAYNYIKDIAEDLCGKIADGRGVTIKEVHEELDMPAAN